MTTPSKCEHSEIIQQSSMFDGRPYCRECEVRFIPSDVLEEARACIVALVQEFHDMARGSDNEGLVTATLARIDAVLGKKTGPSSE